MSRRLGIPHVVLLAGSLGFAAAGCGDDASGQADAGDVDPVDWPAADVPASTTPETGIRREIFQVEAPSPAANPTSGEATPEAFDATQVARYRQDVDPPAPARAIVIAYPGFLGGAGTFDALAKNLVRRAADDGVAIEVWAIDRRSNLLEDRLGLDTAEAAGNAEIAQGYYFGADTIGGEEFPGFRVDDEVSYMSEWGLATHVDDLHAVIALVPEAERRGRVFLLGHSLGASFAEAYAAWRFSLDFRGADELAGLVLVDGALGEAPVSEIEYHEGSSSGLVSVPGIDALRGEGPRYVELPFFGVAVLPRVEILAMRALDEPAAVIADEGRDSALRLLLLMGDRPIPAMTNAAALGWAMDEGSDGISFTAVSCGEPTGGSVEEYENPISQSTLVRPTDSDATYDWIDATSDDPDEFTPLANLAHSFVDGRTNFPEWYFPTRLSLDLGAVGGGAIRPDGWQVEFGLRASDGPLNDAPILAIGTELVEAVQYEAVRSRVAPLIGDGRPAAGVGRDEDGGFRILDASALTHIDPVTASDRPDNPVPAAIVEFVVANAEAGDVTIAVQP
jgi:pimeloyl-ACP methyl ester carboxylesterase